MSYNDNIKGFYPYVYVRAEANIPNPRTYCELQAHIDEWSITGTLPEIITTASANQKVQANIDSKDYELTASSLSENDCLSIEITESGITIDGVAYEVGDIVVYVYNGSSLDNYMLVDISESNDFTYTKIGECETAEMSGEAGETIETTNGSNLVLGEKISYSIDDLNVTGDYSFLRNLNDIDLAYVDHNEELGSYISGVNSSIFFNKSDKIMTNISGEIEVRNIDSKFGILKITEV